MDSKYGIEYIAQCAFEAYSEDRKGIAVNGVTIPVWEKLGLEVQHAWIVAATEVANMIYPPVETCDCEAEVEEETLTWDEYKTGLEELSELFNPDQDVRFIAALDGWLRFWRD